MVPGSTELPPPLQLPQLRDQLQTSLHLCSSIQVVVGFVRSANEALQGGFDMWTMANRNWGSTAWKRSAVAFLQVGAGSSLTAIW